MSEFWTEGAPATRIARAKIQSEIRKAILAEGAAAERASIVAEIREALGLDDGRHARHNLDGAIIDMEHGRADCVCIETMRRVRDQIGDVEQIIERGDHARPEPNGGSHDR